MKKWFAYGASFLLCYVIFLLCTLPASFIVAKVTLPKNIDLQGVSGTVWNMSASKVYIDKTQLEKVHASVGFWSLFTLNPEVDISFGDALLPGPEGQLTVSNLFADIKAEDVNITVAANAIAKKMPMIVPLSAHDFVTLEMDEYTIGKPLCKVAKGKVSWRKASITALDETVKLGSLSANLLCDKGVLVVEVDPKNDLGLTFSAYVRDNGKVSGNGYLKPAAKFPEQVKPLLSFLGKTDSQGRYRLSF